MAEGDGAFDQGGVRRRQCLTVETHVVLEPGAAVAALGDAPFIEYDLVRPDPGRAPFGVGGETLQRLDVEIKDWLVGGHRVLHAHDELDIERAPQPPVPCHPRRVYDVREIESLDFRLHVVIQHLMRKPIDQIGRVFVDAGREIVRADGERGHVGAQRQHAAAFRPRAGAAAS